MLFVDFDQFKRINDVHGHAVGDAVLRDMARRGGADFFSKRIPVGLPEIPVSESRSSPLQWPIIPNPRLGRSPVSPRPCWGINE